MKSNFNNFKIIDGKGFSLKDFDTDYTADLKKEDAEDILKDLVKQVATLQTKLYAANRYAVLILFQGMDASGKDSAIAHTLSGLNPQGCEVHSFKQPNTEELDHDFLWRHYKALPEFGHIGVHNRSHYENVLITKVHPDLLLKEKYPGLISIKKIKEKFWEQRYESIRTFENHLTANGTVIIKFFLHLSKEEQKKRFLKRINNPAKNWKFSAADVDESRYFNDYMKAYEAAIKATSTEDNPWYIIPADKKWFTRIAISSIMLHTLEDLKLKYPVLSDEDEKKMEKAKKILTDDDC